MSKTSIRKIGISSAPKGLPKYPVNKPTITRIVPATTCIPPNWDISS